MSYHLPPPTDHRSALKSPPVDPNPTPGRRPLTPSSLRDVNLSPNSTARSIHYPSPPTGHDLMALFPPTPPPVWVPGPTSGFFHTQERAFFSRGDSSLFRVQIDIDMPAAVTADKGKARAGRSSRGQTIPIHAIPAVPGPAQGQGQMQPPIVQPAKMHITNHIPPDVNTHPQHHTHQHPLAHQQQQQQHAMVVDGPDDAWKRPTPYSERRRGKQTKRRND